LQRRWSWEFERHAARQRNGIGLQADTSTAKHGAKRRAFMFRQE